MTLNSLALASATGLVLAAGAVQAGEPFDGLYFVRAHATAAELFRDRDDCRNTAIHMNEDVAATYSNPQYGALSAMGSALDEDQLHDGGLRQRLQRAVFTDCMKGKGWLQASPTTEELKLLARANVHHPAPLDDWLKSHEPPPDPAANSPVVKTAAPSPK